MLHSGDKRSIMHIQQKPSKNLLLSTFLKLLSINRSTKGAVILTEEVNWDKGYFDGLINENTQI